jgi:hypothetical protein
MHESYTPAPVLTEAQRIELRNHYLMKCVLMPDETWSWQCSDRDAEGVEPTTEDAHEQFGVHLVEVKNSVSE